MSNPTTKTSLPKIYSITALIAFIYAGLTILFAIYKQFFYVDGTWFHGFTANGFAVLSTLAWIGILIVFKMFLNRILKYKKADSLITFSLVFSIIGVYSVALVLFKSVQIYLTLDGVQDINAAMSFSSTSISSAILLILSNVGLVVATVLLGNRIRTIDITLKNLFTILGFSMILMGVFSALSAFSVAGSAAISFLLKAATVAVLGYILKTASQMDTADFPASTEPEKNNNAKVDSQNEAEKKKQINVEEDKTETPLQQEAIPDFNVSELEDKELVISYYEGLSREELNRLETVVSKKYNQDLTVDQTKKLIVYYIADKKLYDHNRFAPK